MVSPAVYALIAEASEHSISVFETVVMDLWEQMQRRPFADDTCISPGQCGEVSIHH